MANLPAGIQTADPLEVVRAAVSACSFETPVSARPVPTQRITGFCGSYQLDSEVVQAELDRLLASKEIVRAPGGYWFPGPTRALQIGSCTTILSIQPTETLRLSIGGVANTLGVLRKLTVVPPDLRQEPLTTWLNAPASTRVWTIGFLAMAETKKEPAAEPVADVFMASEALDKRRSIGSLWSRDAELARLPEGSWFLVRRGRKPTYYALVRRERGASFEMPCEHEDAHRVAYGLGSLSGVVWDAVYTRQSQILAVHAPKLPDAESRLVVAIAEPIADTWQRYRMSEEFVEPVAQVLERLGVRTSIK